MQGRHNLQFAKQMHHLCDAIKWSTIKGGMSKAGYCLSYSSDRAWFEIFVGILGISGYKW